MSSRNNVIRIGVNWQQVNLLPILPTISLTECLNVYAGELVTIYASISQLIQLTNLHTLSPIITIFLDLLSALQAL